MCWLGDGEEGERERESSGQGDPVEGEQSIARAPNSQKCQNSLSWVAALFVKDNNMMYNSVKIPWERSVSGKLRV